jgi:glycosyltransferase involved in cell wall biosynthesis
LAQRTAPADRPENAIPTTTLSPVSSPGDEISIVLPTYNRAEAVRDNLGTLLALDDVVEVVVVVDGCTDATDEVLEGFSDPRLRIVRHPQNRGVSSARNSGIDASRGSWVIFAEDDCRFAADYATVLREEARRLGADLVGVPLLYVDGTDEDAVLVAQRAARANHPSPEETHSRPRNRPS